MTHSSAPTLRSAVGSLLFGALPGEALDPESRAVLEEHRIGGVILFGRNVPPDPPAVRHLTDALHALRPEAPPLVAVDQEGGRVARLGSPFTAFPTAARVGEARSPHFAYHLGASIGRELCAAGVDLDFAPVLDVASNPSNPVIGDRSFGAEPRLVARLGVSVARGLRRAGVIPCGKHFPGHGDTDLDSHLALPTVRRPRQDLQRVELYPFRRAIQAGIETLMTAHVVFPALDPERPATLSPKILRDLLRDQLRFRGVVFSDDILMRAIADRHGPAEAAVLALEAGVDALLVCDGAPASLVEAAEGVRAEAERHPAFRARVEAAAGRVERLRRSHFQRLRRVDPPCPPAGYAAHRELVARIERRASERALV